MAIYEQTEGSTRQACADQAQNEASCRSFEDAYGRNQPCCADRQAVGASSDQADTRGMVIPDSSNRPLNDSDLEGMTSEQILNARNEIYARHGRPFATPSIAAHFESLPWYQKNEQFKESDLSEMEQRNVMFLNMKEVENGWNKAGDRFTGQSYSGDTTGSVLPESSSRNLTQDDVLNLTSNELAIARNELYARHGRQFTTPEFAEHFAKQSWYQPNEKFTDADLSRQEYRNVLFLRIRELDDKLGCQE